ncbi:imidazoleglycerol-phosphate dehydratase HisB [Thermaurantiacus sp.]
MRTATVARTTSETDVRLSVNLDGTGRHAIATGVGFYDHMLAQLARHGLLDLEIETRGDLHIDAHHTVEDTGLALGLAIARALGDRAGITRYGHALIPMDETLTRVALDISGRPGLVWKVAFSQPRLGEMDTELFKEFFHALAQEGGLTLHVETLYGANNHHIVESAFKGLARALRMAVAIDPREGASIPSTKGTLGGASAAP